MLLQEAANHVVVMTSCCYCRRISELKKDEEVHGVSPSAEQLQYLSNLKYIGPELTTMAAASHAIMELRCALKLDEVSVKQHEFLQTLVVSNALLELLVRVAAATGSGKPYSDYDPGWPLLVHPTAFPHGEGQCPAGTWVQLLLNRYPHEQFQENITNHRNREHYLPPPLPGG